MNLKDQVVFRKLTPVKIGGLTIYLEAGGQIEPAKEAVGWVIRNRVDHPSFQGNDVESVCFHHDAFSCYLSLDNPEYEKALAVAANFDLHVDPACPRGVYKDWHPGDAYSLAGSLVAFRGVQNGYIASPFATGDVFMYYREGSPKPKWAETLTFSKQIGELLFYRGR
jgi:hypothetical protein